MPKSFDPGLWPLLARNYGCRKTLAEWDSVLGQQGRNSVPLNKLKGERADFIRCLQTGIPLEIHENYNGTYSALPPAGSMLDSRIDDLALDDLRLHEIDWASLLAVLQQDCRLRGQIRLLSFEPPLWNLGQAEVGSVFFAILNTAHDVQGLLPFLNSMPKASLLLPEASDRIFSALVREGITFQTMDSVSSAALTTVAPDTASSYRISLLDRGWHLVFDGKAAVFPDMAGMRLIEYLLKHPPQQPLHVLDLEDLALPAEVLPVSAPVEDQEDEDDSGQEVAPSFNMAARLQELNLNKDDEEIRTSLVRSLSQLKETVADPDTLSSARVAAEKQAAEIEAFLNQGNLKKPDQSSKTYDRVRNQFNRILKKLRAADRNTGKPSTVLVAFADHLEQHLITPSRRFSGTSRSRKKAGVAQTFTYEPPPGVAWTN
jgi:hypothetical protein